MAPEPSMVGSESYTATDLSKRTDRSSISIPDDGREVTIATDRRNRRRRQSHDAQSVLSHGTNTSLLIEYFEQGKSGSSSGRQPSVRVKVTPSAAKRTRVDRSADGTGLEISELGHGDRAGRARPTHTHRIQLAPHTGEDRLTLGQTGRSRSYSGDYSSLSSFASGPEDAVVGGRGPLNVTFIREAAGGGAASPGDADPANYAADRRRRRRTTSRNGTANGNGDQHYDYYDEHSSAKSAAAAAAKQRSRSVSRESNINQEPGLKPKLVRRRSRSMSRDRITQLDRQRIEQAVRDELLRVQDNPKARRKDGSTSRARAGDDRDRNRDRDTLKPPNVRSRSRSRSRDGAVLDEIAAEKARARRKAARIEGDAQSGLSSATTTATAATNTNPALVELIRGTIREYLLPEIEEMKAKNAGRANFAAPPPLGRNLSVTGPARASSMPDVGKPVVVLSPDADRGAGLGMVIAGGEGDGALSTEDHQRAPGLGMRQSPFHSESGEGVSLIGAVPAASAGAAIGEGHVQMPEAPFRSDTPGTYAETRASILSAKSGLPYPANGKATAMPSTGTTPPPHPAHSEFPELSELNMGGGFDLGGGGGAGGGASTILSDRSGAQSVLSRNEPGAGAPSIASLNFDTEVNHRSRDHDGAGDGDDGASVISSVARGAPTTVQPGYSELSLQDMSIAATSVIAKERKGRRRRSNRDLDELSDIREADDAASTSTASRAKAKAVGLFFAEQREREQERALMNGGGFHDSSIEVRHVTTVTDRAFDDDRRFDKVDTGHQVFDLGANPSMRSTPVLAAHSAVASVLNPSNVGSALSFNHRPSPPPQQPPSPPPQLSATAMPLQHDPMPEFGHHLADDDDEDINTNPSIIQGPGHHHQPANWAIANDYAGDRDRSLNLGPDEDLRRTPISPRPNSRLASPPLGKDEGYISAANPMGSPGTATPIQGMRGDAGMGAIDDMLSDAELYGHQRSRLGSGNSHGMPSPLYDSSTGRGIERIESKDIVALMEHLTVRDAQRNARDTEILVTLVRSAAEMRNSFEDMKKALTDQRHGIVADVDQNTERSVQKILQGPRPLPPSTPRRSRYSKSDEDAEDEAIQTRAKRAGVFRRALKGLSMGSSKDLERIEEMLCKLLGEVEGLKDGQQFYQQSMLQSQSVGTIEQPRNAQDQTEAGPSASLANNSAGNSGYQSAATSRQPSGKAFDPHQAAATAIISPIQEDAVLDTSPRDRGAPLTLDTTPPNPKFAVNTSLGNTPTKSSEKHAKRESGSSSIFPRISRWSETTASTGFKNFLSSKSKPQQEGASEASRSPADFNFWETEAAKGTQADLHHQSPFDSDGQRTERAGSPLVPPSLRDTDATVNQSNRISLDIQHPRPRTTYNHQLEQQAQQLTAEGGFIPSSPQNASVSSLGIYPPLGPGGFQNGKLLSPLAQDAYAQHQAQMTPAAPPPRPPRAAEDESLDGDSSTKRKKHRERDENGDKIRKPKKERTEEEKQRRRERRERKVREGGGGASSPASRKKSRDLLSDGGDGPSVSGHTPSTRLNGPRPLSNASNKENSRRSRHQAANDTYGN